jgi:RND family efflux transporter MFP subunit
VSESTAKTVSIRAQAAAIAMKCLLLVASNLLLAACEEEQVEYMDNTRAIKTITISERGSGQLRRLPGIVEAVDTSSISFEVAGNTREVNVNVGDRIEDGQVLATLDEEPFQLDVEGAEAEVGRAMAQLAAKETEFDRQSILFEKDWVAKSAYEEALAARDSFANQVSFFKSKVKLAQRDLEKTVLEAPFDGVIANKFIDPFQEVVRGEKVFEIYREGAMEVVVSVPETTIGKVYLELPVEVTFPSEQVESLEGQVSEIGTVAHDANAFPIKVALANPPGRVLPGMAAEVTLILGEDDGSTSYLVPISAIAAGDKPQQGYMFVFDPETSTVKKTEISHRGVLENRLMVTEGIAPGDVIAVTGVAFLSDGRKVKLMSEEGAQPKETLPTQSWLTTE